MRCAFEITAVNPAAVAYNKDAVSAALARGGSGPAFTPNVKGQLAVDPEIASSAVAFYKDGREDEVAAGVVRFRLADLASNFGVGCHSSVLQRARLMLDFIVEGFLRMFVARACC
jgi:hypothetical protein